MIGILTFHKSINYGSVLQAWALQNALANCGIFAEIIDYEPKNYSIIYGLFSKELSSSGIKHNIKRAFLSKEILHQKKSFKDFRDKQLKVSDQSYYCDSDFEQIRSRYSTIICGSDQIWNVRAVDCDPIFFLPFDVYEKKIAYSVSVNDTTFTEERCDHELRKQILDFDFVSVRELSGLNKLRTFTDRDDIAMMLDPTLLHEKEDYNKICSDRIISRDYIFLYNVWGSKDAIKAAQIMSKKYDIPVYTGFMSRDLKIIYRLSREGIITEKNHTSPGDFLSLINNAKFIVTDSFHGTAFSLIFEKPFVSINEAIDQNKMKNDERIVSLLNNMGIENRYISVEEVNERQDLLELDYSEISKKRMEKARESIAWLKNAVLS